MPGPRQPLRRSRAAAQLATAGAVLLAAIGYGGAGGRARTVADPVVRVAIQVLATPADGPTGKSRAEVVELLHPSERFDGFLGAGDRGDLSIVGGGRSLASVEGFDHRWEVQVGVRSAATDRIVLDVSWQRLGEPGGAQHAIITLREDEDHVFDLVPSSSGSNSAANALVRVSAALAGTVAAPLLEYELWLVHDSPTGAQRTERVSGRARSGELLPYHFLPLHWALSGEALDDTSAPSVELHVGGSLRGRIGDDGTLDVELQTMRRLAWGDGETGGEGTKKFTMRPGETVAVQLPPAVGYAESVAHGAALPTKGAARAAGVMARGQAARVDFGEFFARHRTAVFLVVHEVH